MGLRKSSESGRRALLCRVKVLRFYRWLQHFYAEVLVLATFSQPLTSLKLNRHNLMWGLMLMMINTSQSRQLRLSGGATQHPGFTDTAVLAVLAVCFNTCVDEIGAGISALGGR